MKMNTLSSAIAASWACCSLFSPIALAQTSSDADQTGELQSKIEQMDKKNQEFEAQLSKLRLDYDDSRKEIESMKKDDSYAELKGSMERISLSGFVRAKYDHDTREDFGAQNNNHHFYMNFEGKMKVSNDWDAHFQSETRKGYTVNQSWRDGDSSSDDQDGTIQRIWVEGRPNNIGIALGTKWWGYGFQNVPFGHAADGIQLDYNVTPTWNAKAFWLRPRQGGLVSMPNGNETTIGGANVTGNLTDKLKTSLTFATNDNHNDDQKMSNMGAVELQMQATQDVILTATYTQTDADSDNASQEYRIDYKNTDLKKVGSYGLYTRLFDFEKYGDYSHDDEWASMPSNTRGIIMGAKYVLFENVVWETFYSLQESITIASTDGDDSGELFRTQIDFHF
jgi:hypothetical protein